MKIIVRHETESDIETISEVTRAAFKNHPHSRQTEEFIVHALRKAGALTISLVAEVEKRVVGHIAFSPVTISDGSVGWYGLGPISVLPGLQKQGIGKALMREGLSQLKKMHAKGCLLVGDLGYYGRFSFKNTTEFTLEGVPTRNFLVLQFEKNKSRGAVMFHEAFAARG